MTTSASTLPRVPPPVEAAPAAVPAVDARDVTRRFGSKVALNRVSLRVHAGTVHALLGPNGAGKTTLLRILTSLASPNEGTVEILGKRPGGRALKSRIGFIPSGDRSFYLRISGRENLAFFARLHGLGRGDALEQADRALASVGLAEPARLRVSTYSHGMQKRLSIARALVTAPEVLLVDEATHDLDPEGGHVVRGLVSELAARGTAVLWTTQRIDEIRGFADRVTLLREGEVAFSGTVPELMAHAIPRRYLLRIQNGGPAGPELTARLQDALAERGTIAEHGGFDSYLLALADDAVLGDAIGAINSTDVDVLTCHQERSDIEEAFLHLTRRQRP